MRSMITLDLEGRVDTEITDFIMRLVKKYSVVAGIHGIVLRELIALDWLAGHKFEAARFAYAYDWLEKQGFVENWRREILG